MIKITKNTIDDALHIFEDMITGIDLNRSIANIAMRDVDDHFRDEIDSQGRKWPPLSLATVARRRNKGNDKIKPLQDTEQMLLSLNTNQTTKKEAIVALNKYDAFFGINVAKLQNEGGRGKILEEDGSVTEIYVPAREFMWLSDLAIKEINALSVPISKEVAAKTK